jgi:hypothetical protein
MRILLYRKEGGTQGSELMKLIGTAVQDGKGEVHQNIQSLVKSLREPAEEKNIAVLLPADRKDLQDLLSIQHLFRDVPLILLVSDHSKETMAIAHQLRPRFIDSLQGDYASTIEVLRKIAKGQRENR